MYSIIQLPDRIDIVNDAEIILSAEKLNSFNGSVLHLCYNGSLALIITHEKTIYKDFTTKITFQNFKDSVSLLANRSGYHLKIKDSIFSVDTRGIQGSLYLLTKQETLIGKVLHPMPSSPLFLMLEPEANEEDIICALTIFLINRLLKEE